MSIEKELDMRGKACPEPVIETRKVLGEMEAGVLSVIVDNDAAAENVRRTATSLGLIAEVQVESENLYRILIQKAGIPSMMPAPHRPSSDTPPERASTAVLIASNRFGEGEPELGDILIRAFVKTLHQLPKLPAHVILVNSGVKLAIEGSVLVDDLNDLADEGVEVLCCGTCLDYYNLKDKLAAGRISNMFDIVSALAAADRTIRP